MTYQLEVGDDARSDIVAILEWSMSRFGPSVQDGYLALIEVVRLLHEAMDIPAQRIPE